MTVGSARLARWAGGQATIPTRSTRARDRRGALGEVELAAAIAFAAPGRASPRRSPRRPRARRPSKGDVRAARRNIQDGWDEGSTSPCSGSLLNAPSDGRRASSMRAPVTSRATPAFFFARARAALESRRRGTSADAPSATPAVAPRPTWECKCDGRIHATGVVLAPMYVGSIFLRSGEGGSTMANKVKLTVGRSCWRRVARSARRARRSALRTTSTAP